MAYRKKHSLKVRRNRAFGRVDGTVRKAVLRYLEKNPDTSANQLQKRLHTSFPTISRVLARIKSDGLADCTGKHRKLWHLIGPKIAGETRLSFRQPIAAIETRDGRANAGRGGRIPRELVLDEALTDLKRAVQVLEDLKAKLHADDLTIEKLGAFLLGVDRSSE